MELVGLLESGLDIDTNSEHSIQKTITLTYRLMTNKNYHDALSQDSFANKLFDILKCDNASETTLKMVLQMIKELANNKDVKRQSFIFDDNVDYNKYYQDEICKNEKWMELIKTSS